MAGSLSPVVRDRIGRLELEPRRPLIICDADEVLFRFVEALEGFLEEVDLYLDLQSFALSGNIRHKETREPYPAEGIKSLMDQFFAVGTRDMAPVEGAADALRSLAGHANIVVLSNLPEPQRRDREAALEQHGMPYPVIANEGAKGAAARALAERCGEPVVFLDDLPPFITSVRQGVPHAHIIHFVADPRLAALIGQAQDADHRIDTWPEAETHILDLISSGGTKG